MISCWCSSVKSLIWSSSLSQWSRSSRRCSDKPSSSWKKCNTLVKKETTKVRRRSSMEPDIDAFNQLAPPIMVQLLLLCKTRDVSSFANQNSKQTLQGALGDLQCPNQVPTGCASSQTKFPTCLCPTGRWRRRSRKWLGSIPGRKTRCSSPSWSGRSASASGSSGTWHPRVPRGCRQSKWQTVECPKIYRKVQG